MKVVVCKVGVLESSWFLPTLPVKSTPLNYNNKYYWGEVELLKNSLSSSLLPTLNVLIYEAFNIY